MGRYIDEILQPGEKVLYSTNAHWIFYWPANRKSNAHWSNTALSRPAAGSRRCNAPCNGLNYPKNRGPTPFPAPGTRLLASNCAAMYTRVLGRTLPLCACPTLLILAGECTSRHGPPRDEIRRHIRRQYRTHSQRRASR